LKDGDVWFIWVCLSLIGYKFSIKVCFTVSTNSIQLFRFNLTFLYDEGSSVTLGWWCTKDDVVTSTNETDRHNIIENTKWTSKRYWQHLVQKTQDKDNQNKTKNK
jgi:hypothetical protein